jgi:glycolate oxidase
MISEKSLEALADIVGPGYLTTRPDDLAVCSTDATRLVFMPEAVARPASPEEVSAILRLAGRERFPVIPRGAGTGQSGGALAVRGGLVLAMDRFDRILSIDPDNMTARVEPGVITGRLSHAAEAVGLFYPPDPASIDISTIGGNVAECAGGLRAVKYGVTRDYVLGLEIVLPTGEILRTGVDTAKGVVGYDLTRLIVGSEGTLAVVTGVTLRLIPLPPARQTMLAFYADPVEAVKTVTGLVRRRVVPTTLEFMDRVCIDCVRGEMGLPVPDNAAALLLMEVDGDEGLVARDAERVEEVALGCGAVQFESARDAEGAELLWKARRNVSPALQSLRPGKVSEDIVVPRTRLADLIAFLQPLSRKWGQPIAAFGHAGDGNIHVHILLDPGDPREKANTDRIVLELFKEVIRMGGTLSGEHGVGITKAPYLGLELTEPARELMLRVKRAFDPHDILNPGKIFSQGL